MDNSSRSQGRKPQERVKGASSCRNAGFCASSGRLHPAIQLWFPLRSPRRAPLSFAISFSLLKNDRKNVAVPRNSRNPVRKAGERARVWLYFG